MGGMEYQLTLTNIIFQPRNSQKTTWLHPRSKHWHLLDYVIVRQQDQRDVLPPESLVINRLHADLISIKLSYTTGQRRAYLPIETHGLVPQPANPFKHGFGKALDTIIPPKRDFRSRKSLNVVTFKGGKAIRKSKFSVPVRYAFQQLIDTTPVAAGSSLNTSGSFSPDQEDLPHIDRYHGLRTNRSSKSKKVRLKHNLKAYHGRKATLASSWLN